jgi:hypothetical protein
VFDQASQMPPGVLPVLGTTSSWVTSLIPQPTLGAPAADASGLASLFPQPGLDLPKIPGLPVPLPENIPLNPTDFICEGTSWSATATDADGVTLPGTPPADRRDDWG